MSYFRHALALDERRAKFKANHWYQRGSNPIDIQKQAQKEEEEKDNKQVGIAKLEESFSKAVHSHKRRQSLKAESFTPPSHPSLGVFGEIPEIHEPKEEHLLPTQSPGKALEKSAAQARRHSSLSLPKVSRTGSLPIELMEKKRTSNKVEPTVLQNVNEKSRKEHDQEEYMKQFLQADAREFGYHEKSTDVLEVSPLSTREKERVIYYAEMKLANRSGSSDVMQIVGVEPYPTRLVTCFLEFLYDG